MAPASYGLSIGQALVAQCFEIVCSVFFLGFCVYLFTETSHVVKPINVYGLDMSLSNFSFCIFGLLTVLSIFSLLSSIFFIFAATRPQAKQMSIYMFTVLPIRNIILGIVSFTLIIIFSSSGSQQVLGRDLTVTLLFIYTFILINVIFVLTYLYAIYRKREELQKSLSILWPIRHAVFVILNLGLILYHITHFSGVLSVIIIIFLFVSSLILLWITKTELCGERSWTLKSRDVREVLLPESATHILKMANNLMKEEHVWNKKNSQQALVNHC